MNFLATRLCVWVLTLALFPVPVNFLARSFQVEVLQCINSRALPPGADARVSLADRVVVYLVKAEAKEPDAWYRDDYRIARLTVGFARRGSRIPHVEASYRVLGLHPEKVWPSILRNRELILGALYEQVSGGKLPPKKPPTEVGWPLAAKALV